MGIEPAARVARIGFGAIFTDCVCIRPYSPRELLLLCSFPMYSLPLTPGRKLKLFQKHDPHKQWWSLDEMRFCAKCGHLFIGRDIQVFEDEKSVIHFQCPTHGCDSGFADWQYPN